jgi:hypothetical protein
MTSQNPENDYSALIKDIKGNIKTRLSDLMSKLLNNAEETLFEMADSATSNEDSTRFFELMRTLKAHKADIAVDFVTNINPYLRPYTVTEAEKARQKLETEDELSLVDQTVMEDMVLVRGMGERAASKYREQLSHLEARLEHLALKTDDIFDKRALAPVNFCQSFDDALGDSFDISNKKILFSFFNDEIASKLDSLYDSINNKLIDAGILPQIKISMSGKTQNRPRPKPAIDPNQPVPGQDEPTGDYGAGYGGAMPGGAPGGAMGPGGAMPGGAPGGGMGPGGAMPGGAPGGGMGPGGAMPGGAPGGGMGPGGAHMSGQPQSIGDGYAMTAAPGHSYHTGGMGHATGGQAPHPGGQPPQGGPAQGDPAQGGSAQAPAEGGQYSHFVAGLPAGQVSQTIGNYIGAPIQKGGAEGGAGGAYFPASTPQHFGHQEILTALSGVQSLPQFVQPDELRFDAAAVKEAVVSEIAKKSGGVVTKRINQIAEKTIDFIELIFDAIIDDEDISDTIKALLLRLQIPIIKASMLDPEFFIYDTHPARLLLDGIAEVGVGVNDHNDETYIELDKIVAIILSDYELQPSTFDKALAKLNEYIEKQEAIAREKEEAAQKQILREHARNTVLKALRTITTGKTLPDSIHPLILKRWPTLMFNHYLANGKENESWVIIVELLRELVESVQPLETPEDLAHLNATRESLVSRAREHLNKTNQSKNDIDQVLEGLEDAHQQLIDRTHFAIEEVEVASQKLAEIEQERAKELPRDEETGEPIPAKIVVPVAARPKLPHNIMPGMWFQVYIGDDKPARRAKLSVIIVEDSKLVFVNHNGDIIVEKEFDEFTHEIEEGRSKVIMGHSIFDHALSSVIGQLRPE